MNEAFGARSASKKNRGKDQEKGKKAPRHAPFYCTGYAIVYAFFKPLKHFILLAERHLRDCNRLRPSDVEMIPSSELATAEQFLHERIPLTRAMGVRVREYGAPGLVLEAPVALNYNHLHTAFGGSINALATLAGYGLLWLELRDESAHLVVAESSIRFLRPIRETIRAVCARPAELELSRFKDGLRENRKSRIELAVAVEENGKCAAEFRGTFVALRG